MGRYSGQSQKAERAGSSCLLVIRERLGHAHISFLTIALGKGGSTARFSVANALPKKAALAQEKNSHKQRLLS
jgi:hypothetical protein